MYIRTQRALAVGVSGIKHLGSILINGNARIGKDVTLHIHTAIVA